MAAPAAPPTVASTAAKRPAEQEPATSWPDIVRDTEQQRIRTSFRLEHLRFKALDSASAQELACRAFVCTETASRESFLLLVPTKLDRVEHLPSEGVRL
jgi:hypothetical protein